MFNKDLEPIELENSDDTEPRWELGGDDDESIEVGHISLSALFMRLRIWLDAI